MILPTISLGLSSIKNKSRSTGLTQIRITQIYLASQQEEDSIKPENKIYSQKKIKKILMILSRSKSENMMERNKLMK